MDPLEVALAPPEPPQPVSPTVSIAIKASRSARECVNFITVRALSNPVVSYRKIGEPGSGGCRRRMIVPTLRTTLAACSHVDQEATKIQ